MALGRSTVPVLWRLARLDFDSVRQRHVLLYPEGAVFLNDTGFAILNLCNGSRSIDEISHILGDQYKCDVSNDVLDYLSQLAERELIFG